MKKFCIGLNIAVAFFAFIFFWKTFRFQWVEGGYMFQFSENRLIISILFVIASLLFTIAYQGNSEK